jgi:hypothetical protein
MNAAAEHDADGSSLLTALQPNAPCIQRLTNHAGPAQSAKHHAGRLLLVRVQALPQPPTHVLLLLLQA